MRRILTTTALFLMVVPTSVAEARQPQSPFEKKIVHLRKKVDRKFSPKTAGRRIIEQGAKNGERPSMKLKVRYRDTLRRMLAPPVVVAPIEATPSAAIQTPVQSSGGGGGCTGMSAESGSDGYNAYNPNGGYIGCYQISPDHYNGGSCSGLGTDPAGQDECAARICATEGPGAWTNPAGQNPCGRLGR